jgi:hypothetical protein
MEEPISRRVFLVRAAGLTLTLGTASLWQPAYAKAVRNPYADGFWLAGDHHIHTRFSPDGQYMIQRQVAEASRHGLHWCVITDHGGPSHDRIALELAYPDLLDARKRHANMLVFQGLEWNIPAGEHGSVILPPTDSEAKVIAEFEALFDERNTSRPNTPANAELDAIEGVRYLQSLTPKPLFMANHPSRRGLDSPGEMRNWSDAGPDVARGFEGTPGHHAAVLTGSARGYYDNEPGSRSWPGYPPESYRTWGGYDWMVARVGGLWDSLLGEGRPWFITSNSDSHRHHSDLTVIDSSTYSTKGFVTETDKKAEKPENGDFHPGEYNKTWAHVPTRSYLAVLDSLRSGNMFTVIGDLIDRLEFYAHNTDRAAPMGGILFLNRAGEDVETVIRLRVPKKPNFSGKSLNLHHIDLIAGDILGAATDRNAMVNPTTRVVAQMKASEAKREGEMLVFRYRFPKVSRSFYIRLRGTNTDVESPRMDDLKVSVWDDLWFYSNPIFVRMD